MAVAVADEAERFELGHPGAGLLGELPDRGPVRWFPRSQLPAREFPEPPEKPRRGASLHEPPARAVDEQDDGGSDGGPCLRARPRDRPGVVELAPRPAAGGERAGVASGPTGKADGLPEFHQRLVERPARAVPERPEERSLEPTADLRSSEVALLADEPGGDPEPVRLERDHRAIEREGGDGSGDVRADARERLELGDRVGEAPPAPEGDRPGRRVEVAGAGVVARTLPDLEDPVERGGGERLDRRERDAEPLEVRDRLGDAGLLEEDFGEPDPVRIAVASPGEGPSVPGEPGEEGPYGPGPECRSAVPRAGGGHVPPVPEEVQV